MDIVDIWVNLVTSSRPPSSSGRRSTRTSPATSGSNRGPLGVDALLALMDELGVATGIFTGGLDRNTDKLLDSVRRAPGPVPRRGRRRRSVRPARNVRRIRELARAPRVLDGAGDAALDAGADDDARHYPVYQVCEELGIPVGINAGIPGPRVRSRVQHPELLEDVLIDFPDLVVIVAHMGHPYEELLMNYMRKWPNLYLSCTAYAPQYMDPTLVQFMNTKTYRGRVLWGSDEPWFPMRRSLAEARALPLDDEAMALFLGGTARRLLDRTSR